MFPLRDTIPSRRVPLALWLLLLANALVFFFELGLSDEGRAELFVRYGIVPERVSLDLSGVADHPLAYTTLASSMFLHGDWLHVIGNLWMLLIFGDNVEDRMGRGRFLFFYLLCGVVAAIVHVAFNPGSQVPTIGASGAIAGVMGAYFVLFPRARVITLVPILFYPLFVELPAFVFLGLWFLTQILSGSASLAAHADVGGIAFLAHVGGFLCGVLTHWLFLRKEREH